MIFAWKLVKVSVLVLVVVVSVLETEMNLLNLFFWFFNWLVIHGMHLVGLEFMTSSSILLFWEEEVWARAYWHLFFWIYGKAFEWLFTLCHEIGMEFEKIFKFVRSEKIWLMNSSSNGASSLVRTSLRIMLHFQNSLGVCIIYKKGLFFVISYMHMDKLKRL